MHELLRYPFDGGEIGKRRRRIRRELISDGTQRKALRVAILGGATTHDLKELLELFLLDSGLAPEFYESNFGAWWEDAMFGAELAEFRPELIIIHTGVRSITAFPSPADSEAEAEACIAAQFARFSSAWEALERRFGCPVIQNNFEKPVFRLYGNRDAWDIHGYTHMTASLNRRMAEYARGHRNFYINDIDTLSADFGLRRWHDGRAWHLYKCSPAPEAVPLLAHSIASVICAILGKSRKALALDLDNTLWGGVVGDDGVEGIEIGHETPGGEVYAEFQRYVRALSGRGILLNVISKNERENALAGLSHPEGELKPGDFTEIIANWEPKDANFAALARRLNILPESIVFCDDNPAERKIVSDAFPGAAVPEFTAPERYAELLDRGGYFEAVTLSADDLARTEMYRANAARAQLAESFGDYRSYLESLAMRAEIRPFSPLYISRIAQLTSKSNQFNLTTLRCTEGEIARMAESPDWFTLYGRLSDRFGDNGVVAVTAAEREGEIAHIRLWLMSCRVLKRDMEYAMLDALAADCAAAGIRTLRGYYYKTAKNAMVAGLYADFGFTQVAAEGEDTVWELDLEGWQPKCDIITVERD
ncbi:MAG: HAD-IIIC family phosphatase [Clostridia bacterium]|nr:HAD-IIIC family phosphatase [Clostridia bacterium]